jgi:hypothetical protein
MHTQAWTARGCCAKPKGYQEWRRKTYRIKPTFLNLVKVCSYSSRDESVRSTSIISKRGSEGMEGVADKRAKTVHIIHIISHLDISVPISVMTGLRSIYRNRQVLMSNPDFDRPSRLKLECYCFGSKFFNNNHVKETVLEDHRQTLSDFDRWKSGLC